MLHMPMELYDLKWYVVMLQAFIFVYGQTTWYDMTDCHNIWYLLYA